MQALTQQHHANKIKAKSTLETNALHRIILDPAVQAKMDIYIRLHNGQPHRDPLMKTAQVEALKQRYKKKFRMNVRKKFTDDESFQNYTGTDAYAMDEELSVTEEEKQRGFHGFDDEETHHLLPLAALAIAKKAMGSKLGKKITGAVGKMGGKLLSKLAGKKKAEASAETAESNANIESKKAKAIRNGVPLEVVQQITKPASVTAEELVQISDRANTTNDEHTTAMIRALKTKLAEHKSFTGEATKSDALAIAQKIVDGNKKNSSKALDAISDAIDAFKSNQTNEAIGKKTPLIIAVILGAVLLGYFIHKLA